MQANRPIRPVFISGFSSIRRLGVFLLPLDGMLLHPALNSPVPIYTPGCRDALHPKCLDQEHNTMSPARARTRTARSEDEHTKHEAPVPHEGGEGKRNFALKY